MKAHAALCLLFAATAQAGPRTSTSYNVAADTVDAGGKRAASASYTNEGNLGAIAGLSTAAPAETMKSGYVAQLYDATVLTLSAATLNVNETATLQLAAWQLLDDETLLAVPATRVAWSATGPFTLAASGLGSAGLVYQNTAATAQGIYLGQTGTLGLTVVNVNLDNFGSYASDGLDDAWQNQFFGLNNPVAAPALDPDGDGQNNLFEYTAGLSPDDPQSRFSLRLATVPGPPAHVRAIFAPIVAGRSYNVEFRTSLTTGNWAPLTATTSSDTGDMRTITDPATSNSKYYRVSVSMP